MPDNLRRPTRGMGSVEAAAALIARRFRLGIDQAQQIVADGVRGGEIRAVLITPGGERLAPSAGDLRDDRLGVEPEIGLIRDGAAPGAFGLVIVPDVLELNLLDVERYAAALLGASSSAPGNRGGRPAQHAWRRAMAQVLLRVHEYGIPATKGELAAELIEWFARNSDEPPDQRTVERFVADIWPAGTCELHPSCTL